MQTPDTDLLNDVATYAESTAGLIEISWNGYGTK